MKTDDFDYELPFERIAQSPAVPRDSCRLMVMDRVSGKLLHTTFSDILDFLEPGDVLVANKTRVLPARLLGTKIPTGANVELLLLKPRFDWNTDGLTWECLARPAARLKPGAKMQFGALDTSLLNAEIIDYSEDKQGGRIVRFSLQNEKTLQDTLTKLGKMPLPPYIKDYTGDPELYQTVYAMEERHSAAAPTAGLHFTSELLQAIQKKGVEVVFVELEVGVDTFRVVSEENAEDHKMHTERYTVGPAVVSAVRRAKERKSRVIAVGTTSVRSLESAYEKNAGSIVEKNRAETSLFLMPGSTFHVVDALVTNFHVPRSTLMMLVSAFASREYILSAYAEAIKKEYRMLSFGDAMLITDLSFNKKSKKHPDNKDNDKAYKNE